MLGKLILVIDDSPTIRKVLEVCLQEEGYEVVSFADGIEAMRWLAHTQQCPGLILLDLHLPRMDGFEVARRIKQHPVFSQTVIITLSRRDGTLDRLKGRLAGIQASLPKPFQTEALMEIVRRYLP